MLERVLQSLGEERRIHYALDRFEAALGEAGNPEKCVNTVIVAGTNGKGSTALFLSSILKEAGHRVGTYLSPHLQHLNERFVTNLNCADSDELDALAAELEPYGKKFGLSYFEFLTLLYFEWAKRQAFDYSVLEVGLGGRLDATNVTVPVAVALPSIGLDHQAYLGTTLPEILNEKLGVLRSKVPLFTGVREPELVRQIEARCREFDSQCTFTQNMSLKTDSVGWEGQEVSVEGLPLKIRNPSVGALENAAVAVSLIQKIFPKITQAQIQAGIEKMRQSGRMEVVQENPRVVLSGDHNPAGIRCLLATLDRLKAEKPNIVCAFSPDKPALEMFETLKRVSNEIEMTEIHDPHAAVERMLARTKPDQTLLITGSLYLVGKVRKKWHQRVAYH